MKQDNGKLLI